MNSRVVIDERHILLALSYEYAKQQTAAQSDIDICEIDGRWKTIIKETTASRLKMQR